MERGALTTALLPAAPVGCPLAAQLHLLCSDPHPRPIPRDRASRYSGRHEDLEYECSVDAERLRAAPLSASGRRGPGTTEVVGQP